TVVTATGIFNVSTATCSYGCVNCCGFTGFAIAPGNVVCFIGDSLLLSAQGTDCLGHTTAFQNVTWGSSQTAVMTVDNSGLMSAVSVGQSTISAQLSDTEITQGQFCAPVPICPTARPVIPTDGTTVRVEVPTADIVGDIIAVSLAPTDLSGTLAVIAQGPSVNKTIFNGTQSGGTPTSSFN